MFKKKKILLTISFLLMANLLLLSCNNTEPTVFSPPDWIIGSWEWSGLEYTFTSDNIVLRSARGRTLDFKTSFNVSEILEIKSDSEYRIDIRSNSDFHHFQRRTTTNVSVLATHFGQGLTVDIDPHALNFTKQ